MAVDINLKALVGQRLKELIEAKGTSGKAVAEKADLVPSQIYKIISATTAPSLDALQRICNVLDISLAEFFSGIEVGRVTTNITTYDVIEHAESMVLNEEQKAALYEYKKMPLSEQQSHLLSVLNKFKSLSAGDQEALVKIINSLSDRERN